MISSPASLRLRLPYPLAFLGREMGLGQRLFQIGPQIREFAGKAGIAPDQHVIGAGMAMGGQHKVDDFTQPALQPVTNNAVADFLGNGETGAYQIVTIAALPHKQHKAGR